MSDTSPMLAAPFSCVQYDPKRCNNSVANCATEENCSHLEPSIHGCYVVWKYNADSVDVLYKGCWTNHNDCDSSECVTSGPSSDASKDIYFCCCNKPMCNHDFRLSFDSQPITATEEQSMKSETPSIFVIDETLKTVIASLVTVFVIGFAILLSFYIIRRYRLHYLLKTLGSQTTLPVRMAGGCSPSSPASSQLRPIRLCEMISRGHYGCVWTATMGSGQQQQQQQQEVAVKIFPAQHVDAWVQEQEIFSVAGMRSHPNILRFIGAEGRGADPPSEFWIITVYHSHGSLYDYLRKNTVTMGQLLHMGSSMLRGLSFLHEEKMNADKTFKPTIVHRDFKSRNVLIKNDLSACVADFGLALVCEHGRTPNDNHGLVGTRRYMAPEVLEGATEFSAFAFRQIDVYAAALVLWELISRCTFGGGSDQLPDGDDYRLPYELEAGLRPSLQDLQDVVVVKKRRPLFKPSWRQDVCGAVICAAIEEMWDNEPEARISAGCAAERLNALRCAQQQQQQNEEHPDHIPVVLCSTGELSPLIGGATEPTATTSTTTTNALSTVCEA